MAAEIRLGRLRGFQTESSRVLTIKSWNRSPIGETVRNYAWLKLGTKSEVKRRIFRFNFIYFSFSCKSADYNIVSLSCSLSRDSRRTQPASFTR